MSEFEQNQTKTPEQGSDQNGLTGLDAAREAGNVWNFNGREMEAYVARGYVEAATDIINPSTQEPTGAILIHRFGWEKAAPFIKREKAFKTSLSRVGRSAYRHR